jgi:hypothetical protein
MECQLFNVSDAKAMCMMVEKHDEAGVTVPDVSQDAPPENKTRVKNASTHTVLTEKTDDTCRKEIEDMEYAAHCQALHVTRLELKMENEKEELNVERALFRSALEEDKCTIAFLMEEVARLRAENVTLDEELNKTKCRTSRDTQKKDIVRKEFVASL